MERLVKETKAKKCDYCDDFAEFKVKEKSLYTYLCKSCSKDIERARQSINE